MCCLVAMITSLSHTQFLDHRADHLFVASTLVSGRRIKVPDSKFVRPA